MRYIASYRRRAAHVVPDDNEQPICGAEINPRFWGFIERDRILDFMASQEQKRRLWHKSFRLCWFCKRKLEDA